MHLFSLSSGLVTLLSFATLALYVAGIAVCGSRIRNGIIYKYGMCFFILHLVIDLFGLLKSYVIIPFIVRRLDYASAIMLLNIPNSLLAIISYIVLIIGFYKGYKNKMNSHY